MERCTASSISGLRGAAGIHQSSGGTHLWHLVETPFRFDCVEHSEHTLLGGAALKSTVLPCFAYTHFQLV